MDMTHGALEDLRVLSLSHGPAGGLVGMVMADFGASVIRIPNPKAPLDQLAAAPMWQRGQTELPLDITNPKDRAKFEELLTGTDVLICNWRPAALEKHQLTWSELVERYPQLIFCHITGFGRHGAMANQPGYEHLVAAFAGRMNLFQGLSDRSGPTFSALQVGIHSATQSALAGTLAALYRRNRTGRGDYVETSILRGLLAYEQGTMLANQFRRSHPDLPQVMPATANLLAPSLYYHPAQTADGRWLQFGNLLPHLFDNFLIATDLIDVLADPDFDAKQMRLRGNKQDTFRARMLSRVQEKTAAEWMDIFIADGGIVAGPYQTSQEALRDSDIVENGHAIEVSPGHVQLGPLAKLSRTPA